MSGTGDLPKRPKRGRGRHLTFAWPMIGATVALFVFTWYAFSAPGGYEDLVFEALGLWILLGGVWLTWLITELTRPRLRVSSRTARRLAHFPVFVLLMGLATGLHAPLWLGFFVSRPAMDNVAHAVMNGKRKPSTIHWIGIYRVDTAWSDGSGEFGFTVKGTADSDYAYMEHGFVYSEPGLNRAEWREDLPKQMSGHWYRYVEQCCGA